MGTILRSVSKSFWGSLIVGIIALLVGLGAVIAFASGQLESTNPLRYLLFGIFFAAMGVAGIVNAVQLSKQPHK